MSQRQFRTSFMALLAIAIAPTLYAQESEEKSAESPKETFEKMKELVDDDKWAEASEMMTKEAADEFCANLVSECLSLTQMDMDFPIPGIAESIAEVADVLETHGLDELEIEMPTIEMKFDSGDSSDDADDEDEEEKAGGHEETMKTVNANQEKILKAMGSEENRWTIVSDLWEARRSSPFGMSVLNGSFEKEEVDGKKATVEIKIGSPDPIEEGGAQIVIAGPPMFAKFKLVKDQWKYDGLDMEKTMEAMKDFMPEGFGPGGKAKSDF